MTVSLRIPADIRIRVAKLAEAADSTSHAFMIEAIRQKLEADESHAEFVAEARRRLARMKRTGAGIPAAEVHAYMERRAAGKPAVRPRARTAIRRTRHAA